MKTLTLTTEEIQAIGYIYLADEKRIEQLTYANYLDTYGEDLCTSPRGAENREYIVENDEDNTFEVWNWGTSGQNNHFVASYETLEEAELDIYRYKEYYIEEHNWNAPCFFGTREGAIQDMADIIDRSVEVCERYLAITELIAEKELLRKKEYQKAYELEKAARALAVEKEAHLIKIDDQFIADIQSSRLMSGFTKNEAQSKAMVSFLDRLNYGKIKSDFWQVFKTITKNI